jgi:membrane complex biogenesis BtpA family protein
MLPEWANTPCVVIGMLHLPPLPGSARYAGDLHAIREAVLRDADALTAAGVHGLMLENFGDVPFFKAAVPPHVVSHMTAVACAITTRLHTPLGINCLRNDGCSALAIAQASGAKFIRVNVLCGARVTDQGVIEGIAADLMRLRAVLNAASIKVLADVDVKHSAPLGPVELEHEVDDVLHRGLADGLIVSGAGTGKATDVKKAQRVRAVAPNAPLFVGSGVTEHTVAHFLAHVTGVIVGTSFKEDGQVDRPVDPARVRALLLRIKN